MVDLHSLLIANRGEIALRVMQTARRLGIRTIAIYTELDQAAPHLRGADEAHRVTSYLDIDGIVAVAQRRGADAVHPGYGFLSERAEFARAVEAAGLKLVGPSAAVMEAMGRKDSARAIAVAAGVAVVPRGEDAGFPVLVKAAAGGGGKGMRVVRAAGDYEEAVAAARREALAAFGDDSMIVEAYVEHGRHIEVQVLADEHGDVVHLFERDCSTQRRHQKVLEEAPAPTITPRIRHQVTASAVALARHVGYQNAGTVEFLLDEAADQAYFLEMNTRLQVEHPVTELITGLDLVELQLRVAAGERLPITQDDVAVTGHAIEARVYAEDAFAGFLPQAGRASVVHWPERVRVDQALEAGQVVHTAYDPMLGKIIAAGRDRETARRALVEALDRTAILGLTTNVGFLRSLVASSAFADASIDTAWLDRTHVPEPDNDLARVFGAWASARSLVLTDGGEVASHPFRCDGWRSGAAPAPMTIDLDRPVIVDRQLGRVDGVEVGEIEVCGDEVTLTVDGVLHRAVVDVRAGMTEVALRGQRFLFARPDVLADPAVAASDGAIAAPMPGTVLDVRVANGDRVEAGEVLIVVEAMKMEAALRAPFAGTVGGVVTSVGSQVALGAVLCVVVPEEAE